MSLNIELIELVKKSISSEPLRFSLEASLEKTNDCGTIACIAGYTVIHSIGILEALEQCTTSGNKPLWFPLKERAMAALRIDTEDANKLFLQSGWCEPYASKYRDLSEEVDTLIWEDFGSIDLCDSDSGLPYSIQERIERSSLENDGHLTSTQVATEEKIIALKKEMADITCQRIDHFVKTGE
ncbi:MAG: hypothetical protein WBB28_02175 [Crinalium sp.]